MSKKNKNKIDKKFLWSILILLIIGVTTFISASLGVYTENRDIFIAMMYRHVGLGVFGGLMVMYLFSRVDFNIWKKLSPLIYLLGILITGLVFVPGLGFSHGGARRWISLGFISFQPAELLKFAVIAFISYWFARHYREIDNYKKGILAFFVIVAPAVLLLAKQPDSGSIVLIAGVSFIIYILRGAPWKHIFSIIGIGVILIGVYVSINPYIIERLKTFSDTSRDPYGSSYQIRQSKIAIGSGQLFGRGLGKSVHKFGSYLPESNSDSIFAIFSEEYGFIGSFLLIIAYIIFAFFGFKIAKRAPNIFAQNLVIGIILLIVIQVFLNIAAISGVIPLSGMPLIFMSNGGTALFVTLAELGIVLNISRHMKNEVKRQR